MPGRIFNIDLFRGPTPLHVDDLPSKSPSATVSDPQRPSMEHIKRPNLGFSKKHGSHDKKDKDRSLSKSKDAKDGARASTSTSPVKLDMIMESPPALFIDPPRQSTGALISGRLQVVPRDGRDVELETIDMYLECTATTKRPVQDRCRECMSTVNDLYEWKFLSKPRTFKASEGVQELPFSHLIPGHIPSTTHGQIGSIDYSLHVRARTRDKRETEFRRDLVISRALRPANERNSVRIFPPTNLSLHVTLPNVVHPIGDFPVLCRMTGITTKREDNQTRWRLKKLTWRIEEHETAISPACAKHGAKVGGEGKGVQHTALRDVGNEELKSGWKTNFDDGEVEGEFRASMDAAIRPQCDVESDNGLKITHNLVLELVIAEEWAPNKKPHQATPTGAARVLRTQFHLNVTERSGLGLTWEDEQPPMYDDVPASPPHYQDDHTSILEYQGEDVHGDIDSLNLNH